MDYVMDDITKSYTHKDGHVADTATQHKYVIGTKVQKEFYDADNMKGYRVYNGKVVEYVTEVGEDGWYLVLYDDGDTEHLLECDLENIMVQVDNNKASTKEKRMYKKKREHRQRKRKIPTSAPHVNGPRHVPMADTPSSIRVKISSVNVSYQL